MTAVLDQSLFQQVVDRALLDVMPQVAGIALLPGGPPPSGQVYTVHTVFVERDVRVELSLCADADLFLRLTQRLMRRETVTPEDVADAAKELFNVLCGHVAVDLARATKLTFRFQIPQVCPGRQIPEGHLQLFELNYRGGGDERIQVIHHAMPAPEPSSGQAGPN